ncbi:UNVERIFIED_CONTAM: hypothetical protein K2H54_044008 [Gekko kuhli]
MLHNFSVVLNEALESDETETKEVVDTNEEANDAAAEETEGVMAGESEVQSEERAESTESERAEESPAEEATSSVPGGEQDAPANSETTQDQGEKKLFGIHFYFVDEEEE